MLDLSFKKFTRQLNERRSAGPKSSSEFQKLAPKMRAAIIDIYSMISTYDIEDYFDNELIK